MRHVPNLITLLRILLIGVFCWLFFQERYVAALAVYLFAFFSDVVDGRIARKYHCISNVGKLLDPLADKLMTVAALICIFLGKERPIYLVIFILVAVKEFLMILGGILLLKSNVVVYADWSGKLATGCFAIGTVLTLISFFREGVEPWNILVLIIATVLSYYAFVHYLIRFYLGNVRERNRVKPPHPPTAA